VFIMMIAPGMPPLHQTRHSRELGRRVEQAVREYQRDNPDVTESDVRTALLQSAPGGDAPEVVRRKRMFGIAAAVMIGGAFALMASTGGRLVEVGTTGWRIVGVIAMICALAFTVIRFANRN
jgi:hypothetical protein